MAHPIPFLTPTQFTEITRFVRQGNTLDAAARLASTPYSRVREIYERGKRIAESDDYEPTSPRYQEMFTVVERKSAEFYIEINKQSALVEDEYRKHIEAAAKKDWRAGERLLKYVNPQKWDPPPASKVTIESTHTERRDININLSLLAVSELEMLDKMLSKITAEPAPQAPALTRGRDVINALTDDTANVGKVPSQLADDTEDQLLNKRPRPVGARMVR